MTRSAAIPLTGSIYALRDPVTGDIRYIGQTIKCLRQRLTAHINEAKRGGDTHRSRWIRGVIATGQVPSIERIDEIAVA